MTSTIQQDTVIKSSSTIDPAIKNLINPDNPSAPLADSSSTEINGFTTLGLCEPIVTALTRHGYTKPTKVQMQAIPAVLGGRDLIVSSPTGSGKTAAFMLPAIQRLTTSSSTPARSSQGNGRSRVQAARPRLLVLTPTRELAVQVREAAENYGSCLRRFRTASIFGGVSYGQQTSSLQRDPEIIVATPGRLIDLLQRRCIDLSQLPMLVLDEADRMLDMGFIDDIERIISHMPKDRQTLLFSATIDNRIDALTHQLMNSPLRIEVKAEIQKKDNIAQSMLWVDDGIHKDRLLSHFLADDSLDQAIIFTATKSDADKLATRLNGSGIKAAPLHGDLPQHARTRTLNSLRSRNLRILVATDIAARGIDVPGITHVFNYDLPKFAEDYVHRIGRTGRAGRNGIAISLVEHSEMGAVKRIERFTRQLLPVNIVEGLEPRRPMPNKAARPAGRNGNARNPNSRSPAGRNAYNRNAPGDRSRFSASGPRNANGQAPQGFNRSEGRSSQPSRSGFSASRNGSTAFASRSRSSRSA